MIVVPVKVYVIALRSSLEDVERAAETEHPVLNTLKGR